MMVFLPVSVAVLSLLSLGQTAPLSSCETLSQPLEIQGPEQLLGKWMRVAMSSNYDKTEWMIKNFHDSFWTSITADNRSDVITQTEVNKMFGLCFANTVKLVIFNNTLWPIINETQRLETFTSKVSLLQTGCTDCLLVLTQTPILGRTMDVLFFMSKRQTVTAAELEEFKRQAECLNLKEPFTLSFENGICPDPQSPGADVIDFTQPFSGDPSRLKAMLDQMLSRAGGVDNIIKTMTDGFLNEN